MRAREQLNAIYLTGAAIVAGFVGLIFKSIVVFIVCLGGLVAILLNGRIVSGQRQLDVRWTMPE